MGGSPPSPPTVIMPAPTAPTLYQSVTPEEDYAAVADAIRRTEKEIGKIQGQRYLEAGTPGQIGAREAAGRATEAAAYLASLPTGDKYLQEITGEKDPFKPVRMAAAKELGYAEKEYSQALKRADEVPQPTISETPSWAKPRPVKKEAEPQKTKTEKTATPKNASRKAAVPAFWVKGLHDRKV